MKYPFKEGQTIEYYALHCIEQRHKHVSKMHEHLWWNQHKKLNRRSLSAALQRLKKDGVVKYDGLWHFAT